MHHPYLTCILLSLAVGLALICASGLLVVRDVYQRMHFSSPITSWCIGLIAIAVWIEDHDPQARGKVIAVMLILFLMNSVLTHATARAVRVRREREWSARDQEMRPADSDGPDDPEKAAAS